MTINGNRFVDPAQRPADYDLYFAHMVDQTAKANALLPAGAPKHKVLVYTDNYASTGVNDTQTFADSWVLDKDGFQQAYINCSKPGGPLRTQMRMFFAGVPVSSVWLLILADAPSPVRFADGKNSFSKVLDEYFELALAKGADGIFHVSLLLLIYILVHARLQYTILPTR
jgi:hypothetical protein